MKGRESREEGIFKQGMEERMEEEGTKRKKGGKEGRWEGIYIKWMGMREEGIFREVMKGKRKEGKDAWKKGE